MIGTEESVGRVAVLVRSPRLDGNEYYSEENEFINPASPPSNTTSLRHSEM